MHNCPETSLIIGCSVPTMVHMKTTHSLLLLAGLLIGTAAHADTSLFTQHGDGYLVIDGYYYLASANYALAGTPAIRYYTSGTQVFIEAETTATNCRRSDGSGLPWANAPFVSIGKNVNQAPGISLRLPTDTQDVLILNCPATAGLGTSAFPVIVINTRGGDAFCDNGTGRPAHMKISECPGLADIPRPSLYRSGFE